MEEKKEFVVYITETLQRKVVANQYYNEEIVLDSTDYLGVDFDAKEK